MKQTIALTFAAALFFTPAVAEDNPDAPDAEMSEGLDLMEEGARMLMRGLIVELEPTLDALRDSFQDMGPAFGTFLEQVDDLRNYQAPELLPNGDILMRRRPDAPIWEPEPDGAEIEL